MKVLVVLAVALALAAETSGYMIRIPTTTTSQPNAVPGEWIHQQKLILPLFENVCEVSNDPLIVSLAEKFGLDSPNEDYLKPDVIINLQNLKSGRGLLSKTEIFTEYNTSHLNELKAISEALFYAKNFDIFYKTAAWARQNLNCGLYLDAIYLAMQYREDTQKLSIPSPYELLPNYFIQNSVIIQAASLASGQNITTPDDVRIDGNAYTFDANYTANFYDNDDESKLAYFREDVSLNSYYFLRKLKLAPWFNADLNGRYGENMYQMMKQFMARYNLERYSNGLPELESLNWDTLSDAPYDPMLIYANGNEFIHRTLPIELPDNEDVALLQTIENNIGTVVSHMRQTGYNKTQILNHLMEILVTGDRSYETLARQILGKDRNKNGSPSVLEHYMTSLRDPIFWKINKKISDIVDGALTLMPSYSRNELYFPGVEVINVEVKKMMTTFDYFEFEVTDALKTSEDRTAFKIKIGQPRLNHKPFSIKINISSLVTQKGLVKIYLGPKMLPGEFSQKKNLFVLLDSFEINFKTGSNIVSRTSDDMKQFSEDYLSLRTLRKKIEDAEFGLNSLPLRTIDLQMGYPARLILPKGSSQGLPLQLFVFVAPLAKKIFNEFYSSASIELNTAVLSPGYPLDLNIGDKDLFELPNAMVKDVIVTHKGDSKVENYGGPGVTKKWYSSTSYDPSSQSNYAYRKEPFDYSSKKDQYGKKDEYSFKNDAAEQDVNIDDQIKDDEPNIQIDVPYRNLASSGYNPTFKKKDTFDYKSKKQQYEKKFDYSSKKVDDDEKNDKEHDIMQMPPIATDTNLINDNSAEHELSIDKENENNTASDSSTPLLPLNDKEVYESYFLEPLKLRASKKHYTLYDYIKHVLRDDEDDSSEEEVYI